MRTKASPKSKSARPASRKNAATAKKLRAAASQDRVLVVGGDQATSAFASAAALAVSLRRELYRVDLALVVSKYIGETEKNLSALFARAEDKNWILFFDEADSLFGKRTEIGDAHDRYANLDINYLLQRLEQFAGVAIFACNSSVNIDPALLRRFQQVIRLPPGKKIPPKMKAPVS